MARKKKARKKTKNRYDPTQITYPSRKSFEGAVNRQAKAQLRPGLGDISTRRREELGAHGTRVGDIQSFYGFDKAAREAAQTRLQSGLQAILGRQDVLGAGAQEGLAAALRSSTAPNDAAAAELGVTMPEGTDPQLVAAIQARAKGNQMGLAGDAAAYLGRGAADIGLSGVEMRTAGTDEMARHRGELEGLSQERRDLMGTLPGLRDQVRQGLVQELLSGSQNDLAWRQFGESRRSNKAQEKLGGRQAQLAEDQFGESKRARRFDERMARKQARLSENQLQLARDELDAKVMEAATTQEAEVASQQAERFDKAAEYLSGYLAPNDQDMKFNEAGKKVFSPGKYKNRVNANKFHEVLTDLMTRFGLDRTTAYQVLRSSSVFRKRAERFADAWNIRSHPR